MSDSEPYKPKLGIDMRIRPPRKGKPRAVPEKRKCEWQDCTQPAEHKAPKGRDRLEEYRWFCLDHVRQFNRNWNFFEGLDDDEVQEFQRSSALGGRPTWKMGTQGVSGKANARRARAGMEDYNDALGILGGERSAKTNAKAPVERTLTRRQTRAFEVFALASNSTKEDVRRQYKLLVKRFHPDAHGGDKGMEDRLREVIDAYQVLRSSGFC